MQLKSLGLIETKGLSAGITAADAALKTANVELLGYEFSKGKGLTLIKLQGDVGAVKAAIDAARAAAEELNGFYSAKVIARPSEGINKFLYPDDTKEVKPATMETAENEEKEQNQSEAPIKETAVEEQDAPDTVMEKSDRKSEKGKNNQKKKNGKEVQ